MKLKILLILQISIILQLKAFLKQHQVEKIPKYPIFKNFEIYSGPLILEVDPSNNMVDKTMHYLFITSTNKPKTDPVLLWLNGDLGCSSLQGWLKGIGPYVLNKNGKDFQQEFNKYSWNQKSNLLFIESLSGVGFSYKNQTKYPNFGDTNTIQEIYKALTIFFKDYSEFINNEFYIGGESYAGVQIPHLAKYILTQNNQNSLKINLKGILIGNGVTDQTEGLRQQAKLDFAWAHQLYSPELRQAQSSSCSINKQAPRCQYALERIYDLLRDLNQHNIYEKCYDFQSPTAEQTDTNDDTNSQVFQKRKSKFQCMDREGIEGFLNNKEVQAALHVYKMPTNKKWKICECLIPRLYKRDPQGSLYIYPELLKSGLNILFFSGDNDLIVPYTEAYQWIPKLNLSIQQKWRSWEVDGQVAGYVTVYDQNFTFLTVKGAGHIVPLYKRKEAYAMFTRFLEKNKF